MEKTGIFGKHPAFGDFIGAGMSKTMQVALEEWLGAVLPRVRDNLGGVWQPFYDIALPLRFWLGEGVVPRALGRPVAGVLVFSHDKVGRRFPLIALSEAGTIPPPTVVADQRWYDALQTLMLEHDTPETAAELADMLTMPSGLSPEPFDGGETAFWAVHRAGAVEELLGNVAPTDHRRAAARRSYWWCAGDASRTATFHALEGWPDASVFQWLLAGNPAEEEEAVAELVPEPSFDPLPELDLEPVVEPQENAETDFGFDVPAGHAVANPWLANDEGEAVSETDAEDIFPDIVVPAGLAVSNPWVANNEEAPEASEPEEPSGPESPFSIRDDAEKRKGDAARDALADDAE